MITIHSQRLTGEWREGYALDVHTVSSAFTGYDQFGHPQFDTRRSAAGDLLYRLKYHEDQDAVDELVEAAALFVKKRRSDLETLVPVPPSRARKVQPVLVLGKRLAEKLHLEYRPRCVSRRREEPELKDVFDYTERARLLKDLHQVERHQVEGKRILLFDDLFRSGATMNSVAQALMKQGKADEVFALTITRTRSKQ